MSRYFTCKKKLNWKPNFDRNSGLKKTIEYFEFLLKDGRQSE